MCYMAVSAMEQNIKQWSMIKIVENIVLVDRVVTEGFTEQTTSRNLKEMKR